MKGTGKGINESGRAGLNPARMEMGWYCIQDSVLVGCLAAHTFAAIQGEDGPWFDCYGGHDGPKKTTRRSDKVVSRRLAVTICCFNPDDPRANSQADFNQKSGDNSGIVYGVTGVCHQMANRILWESGMITSAPGYILTYPTYGVFGLNWLPYLALCKAKAGWSGMAPEYSGLDKEMVDNETEFASAAPDTLYENRMRLLVKARLGTGYSADKTSRLNAILLDFVEKKRAHDDRHLGKTLAPFEHASVVNDLHARALASMSEVIGPADFKALFGCAAEDKPLLIDPEIASSVSQ